MTDNRTTHEITTPSGKAVTLKSYLTARERNELRAVFLSNVSTDPANLQPKIADLSGELLERAERKILELAVVAYDGNSENVIERLLDGSPEDYDFVVVESNKIGNFKPAK